MLTSTTIEKAASLLGYELKERLGAGGYGEVWGATAPGGLPKAIKFLYGMSDEGRAKTELRSLNHIRQIRHPFLLSLERIDVVENQVVIVTELADGSLADLFEDYVQADLPGIPRKELIEYLRQSAEVLDYLYSNHSLQHLDVKPENLMLVGKHVKLGDFGLVKDLRDCSQSILTGLTPTYSAPELFDGCPKSTSDQYSLAIVYQELLTGTRPFSGVTPAQLAMQHLHEAPDVSPLPKADQSVVAKALSKHSDRRFKNCLEFVEHLSNSELLPKQRGRCNVLARYMSETAHRQVDSPSDHPDSTKPRTTTNSINRPIPSEIEWEHGDEPIQDPPRFSPTLFIGLGRSGADVVRLLKTKLQQQLGDLSAVPGIGFMAIDTDQTTLSECSFESKGLTSLAPRELLHVPLRKPEAYRNRNAVHANWLHRRWIFNVPKSLQTEGLRPLGRLAMADHFETICGRLMAQFEPLCAADAVPRSAQALGMQPGDPQPRIVIVGAVSGGFGGGTLLDMSYLVKAMLAELGSNQNNVHGVLIHAQKQPRGQCDLHVANTLAFLTEMRHYTQLGYCGDQGMGIPDMPGICPLDLAYLVELGVDLPDSEWQSRLNEVADFIRLSCCSVAEPRIRQFRQADQERDYFALRSFGIHYLYRLQHNAFMDLAEHVIQQLTHKWTHGDDPQVVAVEALQALETLVAPATLGEAIATHLFTEDSQEQLRQACQVGIETGHLSDDAIRAHVEHMLDSLLEKDGAASSPWSLELAAKSDEYIDGQLRFLGSQLVDWVQSELSRPQLNLARLLNTLRMIQSKLEQTAATQRSSAQELQSTFSKLNARLILDDPQFRPHRKQPNWDYLTDVLINCKKQYLIGQTLTKLVKRFSGLVDQTREELFQLQNHLQHMFQSLTPTPRASAKSADEDNEESLLSRAALARLYGQVPELVAACHDRVFRSFIQPSGGFGQVLQQLDVYQKQFIEEVRMTVVQELFQACIRMNCDHLVATNLSPSNWQELLTAVTEHAGPRISTRRTRARSLICGPHGTQAKFTTQALSQHLPARPAVSFHSSPELLVLFESDDIQLADIAYELINAHPLSLDMSQRILTRNDIDWQPLKNLL